MKTLNAILLLLLLATSALAQYTDKAMSAPVDSTFSFELDEKTVINILTVYSLYHVYMDSTVGIYGYASAGKSQILVNDMYKVNAKRLTILHEFYHIVYWQHGLFPPDEVIDSLAYEKFKQLYGQ